MGSLKGLAVGIGLTAALFVLGLLFHESCLVVRYINLALKLLAVFDLIVCLAILTRAGKARTRILDALFQVLRNFDDHHSKQN